MAKESFRFIHASDFHVERPMGDLFDLPDHLSTPLVEAPWTAADAIFETALIENVDFILLAGDIINPVSTGAVGIAWLLEHFEALNSRGIQVYWCGGMVDEPDRWPDGVPLPDNVHWFSKRQVEALTFRRAGQPLAKILGRSFDGRESIYAAEYAHEIEDQFTICVGYGKADAETLNTIRADYWALGGNHQPTVLQADSPQIRYCGSPQARSLEESGPHGFYLIDVDVDQNIQVQTIETDVFRYARLFIDAADGAFGRDLRQLLGKRIAKLQAECPGRSLLVQWRIQLDLEQATVVGPGAVEETMAWLRREFGHAQPAVWTTDIELLPPKTLPQKWFDEDTILGDFLRTSQQHRKTHGRELNCKALIEAETPGTPVWQATLAAADSVTQAAMIERATLLGVDLLRGHQVDLLAATRRFNGVGN